MPERLNLERLTQAVRGTAAAMRCRTELKPAGGDGDKIFPPTYKRFKDPCYAKEHRIIPGRAEAVECVLLDSVQSQANRMEEALQQAVDEGRLSIPVIEVDFHACNLSWPISKVTSLQAPHRIADAILRDSLYDGKVFRQSDVGKQIDFVSAANATSLYTFCPTALVFGMWDSTGPKGGSGAKFARALVSEIVGIGAEYGVKTASRIDSLQINNNAKPLYETKDKDGLAWTLDESKAAKQGNKVKLYKKHGKPSEANHGNITPSDIDPETKKPYLGGVTVSSIEQTTVLSLPALRRLQFPINGDRPDHEVNTAGRTVLAALALCAAALAAERGFDLRSRCLLWPAAPQEWEILDKPGEEPTRVILEGAPAVELLKDAVAAAERLGLRWRSEPVRLTPSDELVTLVRRSQELAPQQAEDSDGGD